MKKKHFVYISFFLILFHSCKSPETFKSYLDEASQQIAEATEQLSVLQFASSESESNKCQKVKSTFIPALIYWKYENTVDCELRQDYARRSLTQGFSKTADSLGITTIPNSQLEIQILQYPNTFRYTNQAEIYYWGIGFFQNDYRAILPDTSAVIYRYTISRNGQVIDQGQTIIRPHLSVKKDNFHSVKKFVYLYLNDFQQRLYEIGQQISEDMAKKIQNLGLIKPPASSSQKNESTYNGDFK